MIVVGTLNFGCEVFRPHAIESSANILGLGDIDAFGASVDACFEAGLVQPRLVVGASERWEDSFDEGYIMLKPYPDKPSIIVLRNERFGYDVCFGADYNGDEHQDVIAVTIVPQLMDSARAKGPRADGEVSGIQLIDALTGAVIVSRGPLFTNDSDPKRK